MKFRFVHRLLPLLYTLLWVIPLSIFMVYFLEPPQGAIFNVSTWRLVKNALTQGLLSGVLSFLVAIPASYYMAYRTNWLSGALQGLMVIPFFFPLMSTVIAFSILFNLNILSRFEILYTLRAVIIANVFYNAPLFMKYMGEGMKKIPHEIMEVADIQGSSRVRTFVSITFPILKPQIFRAFFLVFTYSFSSFIIVLSLGGLKYSTLEVAIATTLTGGLNFSKALWLGLLQLVILLIINLGGNNIEGYELSGEPQKRSIPKVITIGAVLFLIFEVVIGGTGFIATFIHPMSGVFSLQPLRTIFSPEFNLRYPVLISIRNSLLLGGVGALASTTIAYLLLRYHTKWSNIAVFTTMGLSSAFLGITLIFLNILLSIPLSILLTLGYTLVTVPVAYSFLYQHVRNFPQQVSEAAMLDGASGIKGFFYIRFPMLRPILVSVYLQIIAILCGEFTISYTMQLGRSFPTVSLVSNTLISSKRFAEGAALNGVMLIIVTLLFIGGKRAEGRSYKSSTSGSP